MQEFVVETDTGKAHILQAHGLRLAGPAEVTLVDENDCEIAFFSGVEAAYPRAQNAGPSQAVFPEPGGFDWRDLCGATGWIQVGEGGNTQTLTFVRDIDGCRFVLAARDINQRPSARRHGED